MNDIKLINYVDAELVLLWYGFGATKPIWTERINSNHESYPTLTHSII